MVDQMKTINFEELLYIESQHDLEENQLTMEAVASFLQK